MASEFDRCQASADAHREARRRHRELAMRKKALTAARTDAERALALNNLADPLAFFGRAPEALAALREAAESAPKEAVYWLNLASYLIREGDADAGLDALERARHLSAGGDAYWLWLGRARMLQGRHGEAANAFEQAAQASPSGRHIWRDLALAHLAAGRDDEAERVRREKLLTAYLILARIACRKGKRDQACSMAKEALEAMGGPEQFEEVRWHYCNRRSHEDLIAFVRQVAAEMPSCPWPHWVLARLLAVLADRSSSAAEAREAVRLAPVAGDAIAADPFCQTG